MKRGSYVRNGLLKALIVAVGFSLIPATWAQRPSGAELQYLSSVLPLIQEKNWSAAETKLHDGLANFPRSALLMNALGTVYAQENRSSDAIHAFEQATEWLPNFTAAQLHLGLLLAQGGSCDRAKGLFLATVDGTADAGALSTAADGLAQCKSYTDAVRALEKAHASDPASSAITFNLALARYETGEFSAALSALGDPTATAEQESPEALYLRGKLLAALNKPGSAASLAQACRQHPEADYCNDAAVEMIHEERLTEAIGLIESANKSMPLPDATLFCAQGLAQFRLGRYHDAIETYTKAIRVDPHLDAAREGLGFLLYITGDLEAARSVVEQGLSRPDVNFYLPYLRALVLYRMSNSLWPEARKALAQSIQRNPTFAPSYFLRGKIALEESEASALADFQTAAKLDPKYPLPYYKMAQIYIRQGRREEADQARKQFASLGNQREEELLTKQAQALLLKSAAH